MPLNLTKKYPELLDLIGSMHNMLDSLRGIYEREIENTPDFKFRGIPIHPLKSEGQLDMERTFKHLTTREYDQYDDNGNLLPLKRREFDLARSKRLHWINHHVHECTPDNIEVFTVTERDKKKHMDVTHTYIYDKIHKNVIVFDRKPNRQFYLLTAYYLDEPYAEKTLQKKMKKRLPSVI